MAGTFAILQSNVSHSSQKSSVWLSSKVTPLKMESLRFESLFVYVTIELEICCLISI